MLTTLLTLTLTLGFGVTLADPIVTSDAQEVTHPPLEGEMERERERLYTLESRLEATSHVILREPTYLVIAARQVRPGQVYRLVVNVLPATPSLLVRGIIFRNNIELAAVERECDSSEPQVLELMIPHGSNPGDYRLRLEGTEHGGLTGSAFVNHTSLIFSCRGSTLLIQTDKPVYMQGDTVRFRVIAVDAKVRMVEDAVDVFILSPRGVMVRRWLSRQCHKGAVSLSYLLSKEPEEGTWIIRVEATDTSTQHPFEVEFFSAPRFEVEVRIPSALPGDAGVLSGEVLANYSSGAPITGNVTLTAYVRDLVTKEGVTARLQIALTLPHAVFAGVFPFKFRLSDLAEYVEGQGMWEVKVEAVVGDAYQDSTHTGFALTRIFRSDVNLEFLGGSPQVLHPAMPFKFYLSARLHDGSMVPAQRLTRHRLLVTPEVRLFTGVRRKLLARTVKMTHARYAIWEAEVEVRAELPEVEVSHEVESLRLEAELKDSEGLRCHSSLIAVAHHSPRGRHLQVTTSTRNPKVGEYVILHVRSNYYLDRFRYILLSKGTIVEAGQETMEASLKTFPLPLTAEVAGVATVVVYSAGREQDLIADALTFPVNALTGKGLQVSLHQDYHEEDTLRISMAGPPGSIISLSGTHWSAYSLQSGNDLSYAKVVRQLWGGERGVSRGGGSPLQQVWRSGEGLPQTTLFLPRASPGLDPNSTFAYADLLVLSDGEVPTVPGECSASLNKCLIDGCYGDRQRCDGQFDCVDRVDEKDCDTAQTEEDLVNSFRHHRTSRLSRHFSAPWLWDEVVIGPTGTARTSVRIPTGPAHLALSAFSLHAEEGLSVLEEPILWEGTRGFWMSVEAPKRVAMWEQVGVRVTAVNHHPHPVQAIFVLANSPHYVFVDVEFDPVDPSIQKQRRRAGGEDEHTVEVGSAETHTLHLPIVPLSLGNIIIIVQANVMGRKIQEEIGMFVEPPGAVQVNHTSLLLDLTNRAYFFTFLDLARPTGHVPGSSVVHLALFGGSVGAVQPSVPASATSLLGLPSAGCEPQTFSFLMTVGQMKYWNEMGQQPPLDEKMLFRHLEQVYQTLLGYQNKDGGFRYYRTSTSSSVWVTSLVVRALNTAVTSWPHFLYVDPQVTDKAIRYLLEQQTPHGAWRGLGEADLRDRKMVPPQYSLSGTSTFNLNLTTTSLAIVALTSLQGLPSPLDEQVLVAVTRGSAWLSENLKVVSSSSRAIEVSLVALALHLASSPYALEAFHILNRNARQEVTYVYWGEDLVPLPSWRVESQRPHLQPRHPHTHDAGNVAATAYALRLYSLRGEVLTHSIVRWMHSQRSYDGGWRSTQDTLAAWEALREYSKNEEQDKDTRLTVTVEPLHDHTRAHTFYATPDNLLHLQIHQIDSDWESVRVQGKGRGSAVLQLTSRYYVTQRDLLTPPPTPAFHLTPHASWHGHNGSSIAFRTCVRWIFRESSESSGAAVLEITVPTGYGTSDDELRALVDSGIVPHLKRADFQPRLATFYFEKIPDSNTCIEFTVQRWFPVANLTTVLPVKIYEYYSPELFQLELLDISSVTLDICQVCGSYQCPNCPVLSYYSSLGCVLPTPALPCLLCLLILPNLLPIAS